MIKPKRLQAGDKIAVVSLSSGMCGEKVFLPRFHTGIQRIKDIFGLDVAIMPYALKGIDFIYNHPELRAKDLMDAFTDDSIQGIICAIGGDDTIRLLPYIDYDIIRNNPKVFMGYSDTTANHFMMYKAGLTSFHGPCVMIEFAENLGMHDYTVDYIEKVLFKGLSPIEILPSPKWTAEFLPWYVPKNNATLRRMNEDAKGYELLQGKGIVQGKLLGGCISVMQMFIGSEIWPSLDQWRNKILFLETAEDYPTPENIQFFMRNLLSQGILNVINGVVIGKPLEEKYYEEYKAVYKQIVGVEAGRPQLPILYNINYGHNAPTAIIPYGINAEIDCERKSLTLLESAVL